jgi:hypothetical protein
VAVPAAPTAPTFSTVAATSYVVGWSGVATSWKLERAPDAAGVPGAWTQVLTGVTGSSATETGRAANGATWYRVRGTNAGGDGPWSPASKVLTLPNAPGGPTFTNVTLASVTVAWTPPAGGAASYVVERAPAASGPWLARGTGLTAPVVDDSGLEAARAYWYRALALNAAGGRSSPSAARSVTTLAPIPAAATAPTPGAITTTAATLSWSAVANATGYRLERAPDTAAAPGLPSAPGAWTVRVASSASRTFTDATLTPNGTFWYRVSALSSGGAGAPSTATKVVTLPVAPGAPFALATSQDSVILDWAAPAPGGAWGYRVERGTSAAGPFVVASQGTVAPYSDLFLRAATTYW